FLRRNRVLLASGCFLVLAATFAFRTGAARTRSDRLGELFLELLAPVQRIVASVGRTVTGGWQGARDLFRARQEVVLLRSRLQCLQASSEHWDEIELESDRLRRLLDLRERLVGDLLTARVIGLDATGRSHTMLLDRGATDGAVKGAAVLSPDGVVGQVFQTS